MEHEKIGLSGLKEEIKRLAEEGRSWNSRIRSLMGPDRHSARQDRASVGQRARTALLAYALLRGVSYRRLEPRTRDDDNIGLVQACVASDVMRASSGMTESESEAMVSEWMSSEEGVIP
jgi:hypothetical protein